MKLLVLLVVGYFCYRVMKNWMMTGSAAPDKVSSASVGEIDDVMIQIRFVVSIFRKETVSNCSIEAKSCSFAVRNAKQSLSMPTKKRDCISR